MSIWAKITGAALCLLVAAAAHAQSVETPSGQTVTLYDLRIEPDTGYARFRFLAPAIAPGEGALTYADVADDFPWLCESFALPELQAQGWVAAQIVITLSDREVEQGSTDPDATQFFEGFSTDGATCIWEQF
jgi:hypothetical protein